MKNLIKIGVGISLLMTLGACDDNQANTKTVESSEVKTENKVELENQKTQSVMKDEDYGVYVGYSEDGLDVKYKTQLELDMIAIMQDEINGTVLDSTTNTFYLFSNSDEWTNTLMNMVKNGSTLEDAYEVVSGYKGIVEILPTDYNVVVCNPTNTKNAFIVFENGEITYNIFDEQF